MWLLETQLAFWAYLGQLGSIEPLIRQKGTGRTERIRENSKEQREQKGTETTERNI